MEQQRHIVTFTMDWQGIALSVSYEADYLNMSSHSYAAQGHIQVESIAPARAPFPLADTGYRSHFIPAQHVVEHGGPEVYVRLWIEAAAKSSHWRKYQENARKKRAVAEQLSLF